MAIEDIFKALEEQADAEVNQILHVATVQSDSVEHEARDEADRITKARITAAEDAVRTRSAKAVNAARLQVRRDQAAVRDAAVDDVFAMAMERLEAMRGKPEHERVLTGLIREASARVEGESEIRVAPADVSLAEKIVASMGIKAKVTADPEIRGGVVLSTHGGRVVRRNTYESRLQKVRGIAGARVAEVLTS